MNSPRLNKLRIVFSVNAHVKTRQVLGDTTFDILEAERTDMLAVFQAIKEVLNQLGIQSNFRTYEGTPISEKKVKARLGKHGIPYLRIDGCVASGQPLRQEAKLHHRGREISGSGVLLGPMGFSVSGLA